MKSNHQICPAYGLVAGLALLLAACGDASRKADTESGRPEAPAVVAPAPTEGLPSSDPPPALIADSVPPATDVSAQALALCEAAAKARAAGDLKAWEARVKEAFLIFDSQPLPRDTARRVLETALAYAEATPGEEGTAVAIRFDLQTQGWSLEKRAAYREFHFAERQYAKINHAYEAAESMVRQQQRLNEQSSGQFPGARSSSGLRMDPSLMMKRNAAFQLYMQARQRFESLPGDPPPNNRVQP